jgi:hypothetical protein
VANKETPRPAAAPSNLPTFGESGFDFDPNVQDSRKVDENPELPPMDEEGVNQQLEQLRNAVQAPKSEDDVSWLSDDQLIASVDKCYDNYRLAKISYESLTEVIQNKREAFVATISTGKRDHNNNPIDLVLDFELFLRQMDIRDPKDREGFLKTQLGCWQSYYAEKYVQAFKRLSDVVAELRKRYVKQGYDL